jgi:hypothetical protein
VAATFALGLPAPARAGSFLDPDARLFTLQWPDGPAAGRPSAGAGRLRALPDGGMLFSSGLTDETATSGLFRLSQDGRLEPLLAGRPFAAQTVTPTGELVITRHRGTAIERLEPLTGRRTVIADLAPVLGRTRFERLNGALAALDDGSFVVSNGPSIWRVSAAGAIARVRGNREDVLALVALPGGGFAAEEPGALLIAPAGRPPRRFFVTSFGGIAPSGDGRVLTTTHDEDERPALTLVDQAGQLTRLPSTAGQAFSDGDGGPLAQAVWSEPRSMVVAADGSLIFIADDDRIRALVPADSPRTRIALAESTRQTLELGRVGYWTSVGGGALTLEIRAGEHVVARATGTAVAGGGELTLPAPPPGRYELRLRVANGAGAAEARGDVDIRTALTVPEGREALRDVALRAPGDRRFGPCSQRSPQTVECVVLTTRLAAGGVLTRPTALARATIGADHKVVTTVRRIHSRLPRISASLRLLGRDGSVRVRVRSTARARATARVTMVHYAGGRTVTLRARAHTARILPGRPWEVIVRFSPADAAKVRAWLASEPTIRPTAVVTVVARARPADVTLRQSLGGVGP